MRGFRFDVPAPTSTSASTIAIATTASRGDSNTGCLMSSDAGSWSRLARAAWCDRAVADRRARGVLRREERRRAGVERDEGSAAAKAGIKAGDVIVSINGRRCRDSDDLIDELEDINGEVTIVVLRDKKEMTLKATIDGSVVRVGVRPAQAVIARSTAASLLR